MEPCSDCQHHIPLKDYENNKGLCDDCYDSWVIEDDYDRDDC